MISSNRTEDLSDRLQSVFSEPMRSLRLVRCREAFIFAILVLCSLFSLLVTVSIVAVLASETWQFFAGEEVTVRQFLFGTQWNPLIGCEKHFGIWALISGTLLVTAIAMSVALPLGLVTAIDMSEYAPRRVRDILKPILEILGIVSCSVNDLPTRVDELSERLRSVPGGIGMLVSPIVAAGEC